MEVHSSSRKHWPVLPPCKHAGQEQADKTPSGHRDMEDTRCQLLWEPEEEVPAVCTLVSRFKHRQCTSRHQHEVLWCSKVYALQVSSEMGDSTVNWDGKGGKWQIPYASQKGQRAGLVKRATSRDLWYHFVKRCRCMYLPRRWQFRVTQFLPISDRNEMLKVHWLPETLALPPPKVVPMI